MRGKTSTILACDVGGTLIKLGLVNAGCLLAREVLPAEAHEGLASALKRVELSARGLCLRGSVQLKDIQGFGLAFPGIILSMLLLAALGGGFGTVILAITILGVAGTVRVIRSVVLTVKEMAYVEAAHATGVPNLQIMFRHVAPQCVAPALVLFSASLGGAIFAEAALSFLGLGIPQPAPSWGNMLGGILADQFRPKWWLVLFPGMTISLTVLAFNLIGDALRDYLDPKLRGRLE